MLDADVYGHSVPHLLGIRQKPVLVDKMIVPPVRHEMKLMSIGFFLDDNEPVMWRGPMLHRALEQFLSDVHWGELDTLVVDMPPGTGDVSISLGQLLPRAEAVGRDDAAAARAGGRRPRRDRWRRRRRCGSLGVVENMSGDVFGSGGGAELAHSSACRCSARVPLDRAPARERRHRRAARPADPGCRAGAGDPRDRGADRVARAARRRSRSRSIWLARRGKPAPPRVSQPGQIRGGDDDRNARRAHEVPGGTRHAIEAQALQQLKTARGTSPASRSSRGCCASTRPRPRTHERLVREAPGGPRRRAVHDQGA